MQVGRADNPPADPVGAARRWDDPDRVIDTNEAGPDYPTIQRECPAEDVPDAAEHVEVLFAGIGVDRGDDASLPPRVHTDQGITDGKSLPGKVRFEFGRHSGENEIGPQSSDVVAEQGDRAVGGNQTSNRSGVLSATSNASGPAWCWTICRAGAESHR